MEWTKEERKFRNSTAESFASLSIGLWTISFIGYLRSGFSWETYFLLIVGAITILFGLYLIIPWNWAQKSVLNKLEIDYTIRIIKLIGWLLVLSIFGLRLLQTKITWLVVTGLIVIILALIVFYIGLFTMKKNKDI